MISQRQTGLLLAVLTGVSWSILAILLKIALKVASSGTIVWFRFAFAACLLTILIACIDRRQLAVFKHWPGLAVLGGACLAGNYYGFMKGIELTSPSNAQVLIQLAPVLMIGSGVVFFKEKPRPVQWLGFAVTFAGFAFFFKDQLAMAVTSRENFMQSNGWLLMAAVTWVVYASAQKVLSRTWDPQQINLIIYTLAAVLLSPTADFAQAVNWSAWDWVLMSVLGLNTLIAYGALAMALKMAPASQVSMVIACNPLLTLLFMKILETLRVDWIQPERISSLGYLGAVLVVTGVLLAVSKPLPSATKPTRI